MRHADIGIGGTWAKDLGATTANPFMFATRRENEMHAAIGEREDHVLVNMKRREHLMNTTLQSDSKSGTVTSGMYHPKTTRNLVALRSIK